MIRRTLRDAELQARLERDGYVVFPFLPVDEATALREAYDDLGPNPGDPQLACVSSFHSNDAAYKAEVDAVVRAAFTDALERHFDDMRALPCNFITKWPGGRSGFGLHQDLSLVDETQHRSVEVWVALDETNDQNGQLWMVPGSHQWQPTVRGIHAFPSAYNGVSRRIIERHAVPVPAKLGEAVVFNHATVHFSMPNRTDDRRVVAITDLIPAEAQHVHYFGDGQGTIDIYEIDDSFWVDNSPFTLAQPPPATQKIGQLDFEYHALTDEELDALVADGKAVDRDGPRGAINPAKFYCYRCGSDDVDGGPDRWMGNVTVLCNDCRVAEADHAATADHVSA